MIRKIYGTIDMEGRWRIQRFPKGGVKFHESERNRSLCALHRARRRRRLYPHPRRHGCLHAAVPLHALGGRLARGAARGCGGRRLCAHGARRHPRLCVGRRPELRPAADLRLSRRIHLSGVSHGGARARRRADLRAVLGACLAGMAVVYLFGISYFYIASNYIVDAPITLWLALWYCGILQVVPDFLLCLAAAFIGIRCRKAGLWL